MINSQDIKKGTCIRLDGKLYFCVDFLHVKPGKGNLLVGCQGFGRCDRRRHAYPLYCRQSEIFVETERLTITSIAARKGI